MRISKQGLEFIKSFEGCVLYVYDDLKPPVNGKYREWKGETVKGTLTIGIGHTAAARHPMKPALGLRITDEQALEILDVDLDECEDDVNRLVKVPLTQGQFDACVSLVFNIGVGNFQKSSILKKLNKGDYNGARAAFDLYVKAKGVTLRGLQRRRDGEQALWDSQVPEVPAEGEPGVDHPAEVDVAREPMGAGAAGTSGAAVGVVSGAAAATSAIPPPPPQITETVANAGLWKGMGESVAMMGSFAWQRPIVVSGIVLTVLVLTLGPKFLPEKWRP